MDNGTIYLAVFKEHEPYREDSEDPILLGACSTLEHAQELCRQHYQTLVPERIECAKDHPKDNQLIALYQSPLIFDNGRAFVDVSSITYYGVDISYNIHTMILDTPYWDNE